MNSVIVIIDPPPEPEKVWRRQVSFHEHWKAALEFVAGEARGDDPGVVHIMSMPPLPEGARSDGQT